MKKLLILFSSTLLSFTSTSILNFSKLATEVTNVQELKSIKSWCFKPIYIRKSKYADEWAYFGIDNLNLSYMGIKSINMLHTYNVIEIPELKIRFNDMLILSGDKWNPKIRKLESEPWKPMFYLKVSFNFIVLL